MRSRPTLKDVLPFLILTLAVLVVGFGVALAQAVQPDPLKPDTWFVNAEAVMAIGVILAGYVVNVLTAVGKAAWLTTGNRTRYLAIGISAVVAGIGGYLSLGYLSDVQGIAGAVRALVMTVGAAVFAGLKYESDKLTAAKGAEAAAAKAKLQ